MKQHKEEVAALEARFEAEEVRHIAEINKKLNETHMENVQQTHRALLEKVSWNRKGLDSAIMSLIFQAKRNANTCYKLFLRC